MRLKRMVAADLLSWKKLMAHKWFKPVKFTYAKQRLPIKTNVLYQLICLNKGSAYFEKNQTITGVCAMNIVTLSAKLTIIVAIVVLLGACSYTGRPTISNDTQTELVRQARASLEDLYKVTPEAKELRGQAKGILVFPDVLKAGLMVGGSGGNGVLFSPNGHVMGYYNVASVSFGLQAGAQTFGEAMFMMTSEALSYLDRSDGWSIGAGPSVVLVDSGMAKDFSSTTLRADVYAFVYGQAGLMAGIGIQGQKITKLDPRTKKP